MQVKRLQIYTLPYIVFQFILYDNVSPSQKIDRFVSAK